MKIKVKKPAVDLTDLALGIVILGIVVSIGANILIGIRDSQLTDLTTYTTANETVTAPAVDTASTLSNKWGITVTQCLNASDEAIIQPANYSSSVSATDGTITVTPASGAGQWEGGDWTCSYSAYNTSSNPDWGLADDAATGLAEYGDWFDIIVIVGIAAVIISLIFMAFGRGSGGYGSSGSGSSGIGSY